MAQVLRSHAKETLRFWFGECKNNMRKEWFMKDDAFDASIATKFGNLVEELLQVPGLPKVLKEENFDVKIAAVLCLDQFTRNMYRNDPRAFSGDAIAQEFVLETLEGYHEDFVARHTFEQLFFLMPLMHSEDIGVHEKAQVLFRQVGERAIDPELKGFASKFEEYEQVHFQVIKDYGRYPSRNAALHRESTPAEIEYIKNGGGF
ncbi:membrane protein [Thraustotheca clavata]|uniref:Membrane protein n=1 Tax=Thraustotheca clavata TaxID=74557 RepID=A0A1V9ZN71_9STRA|nr:membrane protein [Thraustotheca clavata]